MNKWLLSTAITGSIIVMAACGGNDDETVTEPANTETTEENQNETGTANDQSDASSTISFKEFEMDVDYEGNDNDFEVSYESEGNVEAVYEDERNMMMLAGDDAYQEIEPALSSLDINADTSNEEVIQAVIDAFEVEEGYQSIEIEITFEDGTKKEYEQRP